MKQYLDEKFARAARIAGNPYFILFNLVFFVSACIFAQNIALWLVVWLDIIISIWTLELDLIIVNQNNRQNDSNTDQLERLVGLDQKIIKIEEEHGDELRLIRQELRELRAQIGILIQVAPIKKPRGRDGKFCKA